MPECYKKIACDEYNTSSWWEYIFYPLFIVLIDQVAVLEFFRLECKILDFP